MLKKGAVSERAPSLTILTPCDLAGDKQKIHEVACLLDRHHLHFVAEYL